MSAPYRSATGIIPEAAFDNDIPAQGPRTPKLGSVGQAGQDNIATRIAKRKKDKAAKKAKPTKRLAAIPFDTPKNLHAITVYSAALSRGFHQLRVSVATQLRRRTRKADPTPEQRLAEAQAIVDALDLSVLHVIVEDLANAGVDVASDAGILAIAQFGMSDNEKLVNQIDTRAAEWATTRAAELVGMRYDDNGDLVPSANADMTIDDATRDMLRSSITEGLSEGHTIDEIANDLVDLYAFSQERADLIANTEVRRAQSEGALVGYKETEALGVEILKEWLVADTPCEICEPNGAQGPIPLDEPFSSGDMTSPAHPHCRCAIAPVVDPDAFEPEINPEEDMGYYAVAKRTE